MPQQITLTDDKREFAGSSASRRLRRTGFVPAVVYGKKQTALNLQLNEKSFTNLLEHSASEHIVVTLDIAGEGPKLALVQHVQHNAISSRITHVDFHAVDPDEKIHLTVPLHLTGEAAGLKLGGILEHFLHVLEVHCKPLDLPETISIDITEMKRGEALHLKQIDLPPGVETHVDPEVVIVRIAEPKVEEVVEVAVKEGKDAKKGKGAAKPAAAKPDAAAAKK
ncbi:MAG: bl25 bact ctc: ribosomal protein bl25 ctc-form [Verrucomicrobiaceae bacterium]|nr:bl25 bact ctc: ribosomal protein bl25 ctc-form [Verrucomicrobiaceae bacterium]